MEAARRIREAVQRVSALRESAWSSPSVRGALVQIKSIQARRFSGTYADLLSYGQYADAARFFLEELYSDKDYAERDAQFARIAGAIERFFPSQVVATAVALAELHAFTEDMDHAMAVVWSDLEGLSGAEAGRYIAAWRSVGRRSDREGQLAVVLDIGREMTKLTRTPGLRTLLKMMRAPASAAGLSSLQRFLEKGFDTFAAMARRPGGAEAFLQIIAAREKALIASLFDSEVVACETELACTLGQAR
ncbi:MAG: hypothetical protein H7255_04600 [Ramlibacter sp.]|nr:hypothetical protein [Ramlibacter sp.]